mmetsp:Transcript_35128/g.82292  ORF Transcript_35128/g.82292 Transcript_35128/m.82292 type:complete len:638 (+) Transcript_35128:537-2450(+)
MLGGRAARVRLGVVWCRRVAAKPLAAAALAVGEGACRIPLVHVLLQLLLLLVALEPVVVVEPGDGRLPHDGRDGERGAEDGDGDGEGGAAAVVGGLDADLEVVDVLHHAVEEGDDEDDERVHLEVVEGGDDEGLHAHREEEEEVDDGDAHGVLGVLPREQEDEDRGHDQLVHRVHHLVVPVLWLEGDKHVADAPQRLALLLGLVLVPLQGGYHDPALTFLAAGAHHHHRLERGEGDRVEVVLVIVPRTLKVSDQHAGLLLGHQLDGLVAGEHVHVEHHPRHLALKLLARLLAREVDLGQQAPVLHLPVLLPVTLTILLVVQVAHPLLEGPRLEQLLVPPRPLAVPPEEAGKHLHLGGRRLELVVVDHGGEERLVGLLPRDVGNPLLPQYAEDEEGDADGVHDDGDDGQVEEGAARGGGARLGHVCGQHPLFSNLPAVDSGESHDRHGGVDEEHEEGLAPEVGSRHLLVLGVLAPPPVVELAEGQDDEGGDDEHGRDDDGGDRVCEEFVAEAHAAHEARHRGKREEVEARDLRTIHDVVVLLRPVQPVESDWQRAEDLVEADDDLAVARHGAHRHLHRARRHRVKHPVELAPTVPPGSHARPPHQPCPPGLPGRRPGSRGLGGGVGAEVRVALVPKNL